MPLPSVGNLGIELWFNWELDGKGGNFVREQRWLATGGDGPRGKLVILRLHQGAELFGLIPHTIIYPQIIPVKK